MKQKNKKILICVSGSIAAYKVCDLIRKLKKTNKFEIKCIMTKSAENFINETTLQTLSGNRVYKNIFNSNFYDPMHVSLAEWPDVIVIVPATCAVISKLAIALTNELLTCVVIASRKPVLICPAMESNMWNNPLTKDNVRKLKKAGYYFLGPEEGDLVSGKKGIGRLVSIDKIYQKIIDLTKK